MNATVDAAHASDNQSPSASADGPVTASGHRLRKAPKPQAFDSRKLDLAMAGFMIVYPGKYYEVADVNAEHIGTPIIRRFFTVLRSMQDGADGPAGLSSAAAIIGRATHAGIPETEAALLIAECRDHAPADAGGIQSIKKQLMDVAMRRVSGEIALKMQADAEEQLGSDDIIERFSGYINTALKHAQTLPVKSLEDEIDREILRVTSGETGQEMGYRTGLEALDSMLSGLHGGELIILAARPSMGKSALLSHMTQAMCVQQNLPGGIFALEMPARDYTQRMISSVAGINIVKVKRNAMSPREREIYIEHAKRIRKGRLRVCDIGGISLPQIQALARRWYYEDGIKWLAIDFLQLVDHRQRRGETTNDAITRTSVALKSMAMQLNIPIIALSQLNRDPDKRGTKPEDKRPMMSDLRSSGSLEQDADVVLLLFREFQYYNKEEQAEALKHPYEKAEIIICKQRNGPTGSVDACWVRECAGFDDWNEGQYGLPI